jgi:hypothetical protein
VISLYLNTQADQHGRDNFDSFVRKELSARARTYPIRSSERESFDRDAERINKYLRDDLRPSTNGLALFACAGADDFFEAAQLEAPVEEHRLYVSNQPHLYPLALLNDQYPRYAALLADTRSARLFVFGLGELLDKQEVRSPKVNRTSVGGWSQARYQRHVDNVHLHHAKEVIEVLDRLVREDRVEKIILAGDEVIVPVLREQMPRHLDEKLVDGAANGCAGNFHRKSRIARRCRRDRCVPSLPHLNEGRPPPSRDYLGGRPLAIADVWNES